MSHYLLTWAALMTLLLLTIGSAYIPMGAFNAVVNMVIAVIKTLLIMAVLMHLAAARPVIRLASAVGFLFLSLLIWLSLSDYLTR